MERRYFAAQQNQLLDFRVGSGTDILRTSTDVRYSLESGHDWNVRFVPVPDL